MSSLGIEVDAIHLRTTSVAAFLYGIALAVRTKVVKIEHIVE